MSNLRPRHGLAENKQIVVRELLEILLQLQVTMGCQLLPTVFDDMYHFTGIRIVTDSL